MNEQHRIISVAEARKLLGKSASDRFQDTQIETIINQLDFIATLAVRKHKKKPP